MVYGGCARCCNYQLQIFPNCIEIPGVFYVCREAQERQEDALHLAHGGHLAKKFP